MENLIDDRIGRARCVLLAGCGGGYDVFAAVPMAMRALALGKRVVFGSLSFADLVGQVGATRVGPSGILVSADLEPRAYFPELVLRRWLDSRGIEAPVHAYPRAGVAGVRADVRAIVEREGVDAVVLVDGGTDALIKGDEEGLGTVVEDAMSVLAARGLAVGSTSLACLGFGVDHFHGVSHRSFLENTAEATRLGGFLGVSGVVRGTVGGDAFLDLVATANRESPFRPSIVANSVASAIGGAFGDAQVVGRTRGTELFVNPLMSLYWCYDLAVVAGMMGFAAAAEAAEDVEGMVLAVTGHHRRQALRPALPIPL